MKQIKFGLLLVSLCIMAGCTIAAPGVRIAVPLPGVDINLDGSHARHVGHGEHEDDFCPPGQAKKGNC